MGMRMGMATGAKVGARMGIGARSRRPGGGSTRGSAGTGRDGTERAGLGWAVCVCGAGWVCGEPSQPRGCGDTAAFGAGHGQPGSPRTQLSGEKSQGRRSCKSSNENASLWKAMGCVGAKLRQPACIYKV